MKIVKGLVCSLIVSASLLVESQCSPTYTYHAYIKHPHHSHTVYNGVNVSLNFEPGFQFSSDYGYNRPDYDEYVFSQEGDTGNNATSSSERGSPLSVGRYKNFDKKTRKELKEWSYENFKHYFERTYIGGVSYLSKTHEIFNRFNLYQFPWFKTLIRGLSGYDTYILELEGRLNSKKFKKNIYRIQGFGKHGFERWIRTEAKRLRKKQIEREGNRQFLQQQKERKKQLNAASVEWLARKNRRVDLTKERAQEHETTRDYILTTLRCQYKGLPGETNATVTKTIFFDSDHHQVLYEELTLIVEHASSTYVEKVGKLGLKLLEGGFKNQQDAQLIADTVLRFEDIEGLCLHRGVADLFGYAIHLYDFRPVDFIGRKIVTTINEAAELYASIDVQDGIAKEIGDAFAQAVIVHERSLLHEADRLNKAEEIEASYSLLVLAKKAKNVAIAALAFSKNVAIGAGTFVENVARGGMQALHDNAQLIPSVVKGVYRAITAIIEDPAPLQDFLFSWHSMLDDSLVLEQAGYAKHVFEEQQCARKRTYDRLCRMASSLLSTGQHFVTHMVDHLNERFSPFDVVFFDNKPFSKDETIEQWRMRYQERIKQLPKITFDPGKIGYEIGRFGGDLALFHYVGKSLSVLRKVLRGSINSAVVDRAALAIENVSEGASFAEIEQAVDKAIKEGGVLASVQREEIKKIVALAVQGKKEAVDSLLKLVKNNPSIVKTGDVSFAIETLLEFKGEMPPINLRHIFDVELRKGGPKGFHHAKSYPERIVEIVSPPNQHGVYEAFYRYNNKKKFSTFFPDSWNRPKVLKKIEEAWENIIKINEHGVVGQTSEGIKIEFWFRKAKDTGKVTIDSVLPQYVR